MSDDAKIVAMVCIAYVVVFVAGLSLGQSIGREDERARQCHSAFADAYTITDSLRLYKKGCAP